MLGRKLVAESFGTFCLVFAGTGAAVVNEVTQGGVTHVGVALVFGLVVMALIYALGDVWIYCLGPLAGSLAAVPLVRVLLARDDAPPNAGAGA